MGKFQRFPCKDLMVAKSGVFSIHCIETGKILFIGAEQIRKEYDRIRDLLVVSEEDKTVFYENEEIQADWNECGASAFEFMVEAYTDEYLVKAERMNQSAKTYGYIVYGHSKPEVVSTKETLNTELDPVTTEAPNEARRGKIPSRAVVQLKKGTMEKIARYDTIGLAAKAVNKSRGNISQQLRGVLHYGPWDWMYEDEYEGKIK